MSSECSCPVTAVALGCVFGTVGVIALVIGLVILVRWSIVRRNEHKPGIVSARRFSFAASIDGVNNEAYEGDDPNVIMMMSTGTNKSKKKQSKKSRTNDERGSSSSLDTLNNNNVDVVDVGLTSRVGGGFGFDICGNNKDGIAINNVHDRGPAKESKLVDKGDKIVSLTISFNNMVYEDALTLLSYANPYPVILKLAKRKPRGTLKKFKRPESQTKIINEETRPCEISIDSVDNHVDADSVGATLDANLIGDKSLKPTGSNASLNGEPVVESTEQEDRPSEEMEVQIVHEADNHTQVSAMEGDNSDAGEDKSDDDTQRIAPAHLPANIRNILESKKAQSEAVNNVQIHSRQNSRENILLSPGATAGLEFILNGDTVSDTAAEQKTESNEQHMSTAEITMESASKPSLKLSSHKDLSYDLFFKKLIESSPIFQESQAYKFAFSCESLNGEQLFHAQAMLPHSGKPFMGTQTVDMFNKKRSPHSTKSRNSRQKSNIQTQKSTRPQIYSVPTPVTQTSTSANSTPTNQRTKPQTFNEDQTVKFTSSIHDHYKPSPLTLSDTPNPIQKPPRAIKSALQQSHDTPSKVSVETSSQQNKLTEADSSNSMQSNSTQLLLSESNIQEQTIRFDSSTPFIEDEIISLTSNESQKSDDPVTLEEIDLQTNQHYLHLEVEDSGHTIDSNTVGYTNISNNRHSVDTHNAEDNENSINNTVTIDARVTVGLEDVPLTSDDNREINESQVQANSPARAPGLVMTSCSDNITGAITI